MDPADWTFCNSDPRTVNDYWWYHDQLSQRKRYLFMSAVGTHAARLMTEPECVRASQICAEYAEGQIDVVRFSDFMDEASAARCRSQCAIASGQAANDFVTFLADDGKLNECVEAAECAFGYAAAVQAGDLEPDTAIAAWEAIERYESFRTGMAQATRMFTAYCLDIFGPNPFRPVAFDPSWRTSTTVGLARTMYESRDFGAMPVLADALEEAGCDSPDVLGHCRDPNGGHVRGCWVVDLVLGKS
jgi:hypothetical protein